MMYDYRFAAYTYKPFTRSLQRLEGKSRESGNTLFIRDVEYVTDRLRASPQFAVLGKRV
jgi:hypothetical protein